MSWPLAFGFPNTTQYMNNLSNFSYPFYPNQYGSNVMMNPVSSPYFNFPGSYGLFSQGCNQTTLNNFYGQNSLPLAQNCSLDLLNRNCFQKRQNIIQGEEKDKQFKSSSCEGTQIKMVRFRRRRTVRKLKNLISHNSSLRNDTKNIPKNYGKAVLSYIQKNSRQAKQLLSRFQVDFLEFMMFIKSFKSRINTIHDLREMWGENQKSDKLKKCIRILSYHFMRKKCIPYIFNSRVKNYHTHIKYRKKIMQGIQKPQNFTKIKQF